jgi:ABC-type lipoprotein export system ATPase subunit
MKNEAKTMMVFGETGSGKSTFLNAIVNYLAMVDIEDSFRYQLVV